MEGFSKLFDLCANDISCNGPLTDISMSDYPFKCLKITGHSDPAKDVSMCYYTDQYQNHLLSGITPYMTKSGPASISDISGTLLDKTKFVGATGVKGDKGDKGDQGDQGSRGYRGYSSNCVIF